MEPREVQAEINHILSVMNIFSNSGYYNPFGLLRIPNNASEAMIKKAYYTRCKLLHPDRNKVNSQLASEALKYVILAYERIIIPENRKKWKEYVINHEANTKQNIITIRSTSSYTYPTSDDTQQYQVYDHFCNSLLNMLNTQNSEQTVNDNPNAYIQNYLRTATN
eukprot:TRINITY_DN12493_c0_g1_i1.p1 TRINITY_DN12493_c0_g1~~TRINITY_DN12493_c0_g1_i1.p1  ORF type:complete len:165 (+),score=15.86 TRINITY_DN12493_c0_g1_i1:2-496(+)